MAFDPMRRKTQMKNVAGFHSFVRLGLAGTRELPGVRKAFGMIECHTEGCATR